VNLQLMNPVRRRGNISPLVVLRLVTALAKNRLLVGGLVVYILLATAFEDAGTSGSSILAVNQNLTLITKDSSTAGVSISASDEIHTAPVVPNNDKKASFASDNDDDGTVIYSQARSDRSGAAIQDMLMCHAYAYHHGKQYGGACTDWDLPQFQGKRHDRERLLHAIGLDEALPIECPKKNTIKLMNRQHYIQNDTMIFTRDYQSYLHGLVKYPETTNSISEIAVHIRRGDIDPCRPRTRGYPRYLPNLHFLRLIHRYNPQNESRVQIFSESTSFESFDVFRERGYHVALDGDIGDVWKGILTSDVVILSRSSFSLVPAVMSKGTIVYTPFWHAPLPNWDIVDDALLNETHVEFRRLKETCPKKKKKKKGK
jgi:hypothetical protein